VGAILPAPTGDRDKDSQSVLDAFNSGYRKFWLRAGTYKWHKLTGLPPVVIEGEGAGATFIEIEDNGDVGIDLQTYESGLRDLTLVAQSGASKTTSGVRLRDRAWLEHVNVQGANMLDGIVIFGNHQNLCEVRSSGGRYNVSWRGYTTIGNQTLENVDLTGARKASVGVAGDSTIDANVWSQVHLGYCPGGICFERRAKPDRDVALVMSVMNTVAFEVCSNYDILDEGYGQYVFGAPIGRVSYDVKWTGGGTGPNLGTPGRNLQYFDPNQPSDYAVTLDTIHDWVLVGSARCSSPIFGTPGSVGTWKVRNLDAEISRYTAQGYSRVTLA